MIPHAACVDYHWQPFPHHPQRRAGVAVDRTNERHVRIVVDESASRSSRALRSDAAGVTERTLLQMLDVSDRRPKNTGKFLTLHRKRRRVRLGSDAAGESSFRADDVYHGQTQCALSGADRWPFNAFLLDAVSGGRSLPVLLVHLFGRYGLIDYFDLDPVKVWKCFDLVEEGYHSNNPYHNAVHASDVCQAMHCFLQEEKLARHVTPMEILAALLAAVCHDLDHPGVNQPFLIATSNHLATLYNNSSVLENHHWRSAVGCFVESGIFDHFDKHFWEDLIWQIRSLVLATDITRQQEFLSRFKRYTEGDLLDMTNIDYRHFILQIALKCADICNPCRPWDISKMWSDRVCEEFFRQGDIERQLNLQVTSLCDRFTMSKPKIQAGFFRFVVFPLFEAWDGFQQTAMSAKLLQNLKINQGEWEKLADMEAEMAKKAVANEKMEDALQEAASSLSTTEDEADEPATDVATRTTEEPVPFHVLRGRRHSMPLSVPKLLPRSSRRQSFPRHRTLSQVRALSAEELMPDSRITSISAEASRLVGLFGERRCSRHLVKQLTFPPDHPQMPHLHSQSWQEACAELLPGVLCPTVVAELSVQPLSVVSTARSTAATKSVVFCTDPVADGNDESHECKTSKGCNTPPSALDHHTNLHALRFCHPLSDGLGSAPAIYRWTSRRASAPIILPKANEETAALRGRRGSAPFDSGLFKRQKQSPNRRNSLPSTRQEASPGVWSVTPPDPLGIQYRLQKRRRSAPLELLFTDLLTAASRMSPIANHRSSEELSSLPSPLANLRNVQNLWGSLTEQSSKLLQAGGSLDLGVLGGAVTDDEMEPAHLYQNEEAWLPRSQRRGSVPVEVCLFPIVDP